jgi:hypothetical protein
MESCIYIYIVHIIYMYIIYCFRITAKQTCNIHPRVGFTGRICRTPLWDVPALSAMAGSLPLNSLDIMSELQVHSCVRNYQLLSAVCWRAQGIDHDRWNTSYCSLHFKSFSVMFGKILVGKAGVVPVMFLHSGGSSTSRRRCHHHLHLDYHRGCQAHILNTYIIEYPS